MKSKTRKALTTLGAIVGLASIIPITWKVMECVEGERFYNSEYYSADSLKLETDSDSTKIYKMLPDSSYSLVGGVANEDVDTLYYMSGELTDQSCAAHIQTNHYEILYVQIDTTQQFIDRYNAKKELFEGE